VSTKPTVSLLTLGCARNDVDSEELAARLTGDGWTVTADQSARADVIVVNTCGFVAAAKQESVDAILESGTAGVPVVAVGCMAERYGQELAAELPEAAAVVGFDGYGDLGDRLHRVVAGERLPSHRPQDRRTLLPVTPVMRTGRTTPPGHAVADPDGIDLPGASSRVLRRRLSAGPVAALKIASGCDRRCSFCAIPRFRGSFVSRRPDEVLAEARWLAGQGVQELVLVSENSTSYGKDLGAPRLLESLLADLATLDGVDRVRVSYLQPAELRPSLVAVIATTPGVSPYFDLSFQHASGRLLRRMRRFGEGRSFLDLIAQIRDAAPQAGIRSNVIVGFPGEAQSDFDELVAFVNEAQLDALGVFGYSDEDQTEAATLGDHVDEDVIAQRVSAISAVADGVAAARAADRVDDRATVLVERSRRGSALGRCDFQGPEDGETVVVGEHGPGTLVDVVITGTDGVDLTGRAL
jgi:ribosomal protein S12 methylthiotransferase RimO